MGMLVWYTLMMYIASYPLVLSIRKSAKKSDLAEDIPEDYQIDEEAETAKRTE